MELFRRLAFKYYPFVLLVVVSSGFVGWYFGDMSQRALYSEGNEIYAIPEVVRPGWLGGLLGAVFGVLVGVPYSLELAYYRSYQSVGWIIVHCGIKFGCAAGVMCSILVHIALMIFYKHSGFFPLLVGSVYGSVAGVGLGVVSSVVCVCVYRGDDG